MERKPCQNPFFSGVAISRQRNGLRVWNFRKLAPSYEHSKRVVVG